MTARLTLTLLDGEYTVARFAPDDPLVGSWCAAAIAVVPPRPAGLGASITTTSDECSIVGPTALLDGAPPTSAAEHGWRALRLEGPFEFTLTGILASVLGPLAHATVPIFALSTFDTDYVLVPELRLGAARAALVGAGHTLL